MLFVASFLGLFGLLLSASFSGSETAFYRVPRLRLKLDALEGDPVARRLLRLINNPSSFVATILVGNNVANYAVSVATVLAVVALWPHSQGLAVEIGSTLLLAPLLFVYGEMFPKYLCLRAPHRMLRLLSPFILFFYHLFLPVTSLLWFVNKLLAWGLGESREMIELSLGRKELPRVLDEGQENGILFEAQRRLASGIFDVSDQRIGDWAVPPAQWPRITTDMKPAAVLEIARKHNLVELPVFDIETKDDYAGTTDDSAAPDHSAMPTGFVRAISARFMSA